MVIGLFFNWSLTPASINLLILFHGVVYGVLVHPFLTNLTVVLKWKIDSQNETDGFKGLNFVSCSVG